MNYLAHLASFLSVYRNGSITKAAKELNLTQPSITKHIKSLEKKLGFLLFERNKKRLEATLNAHHVYKNLSPHFDSIEAFVDEVHSSPVMISIGCSWGLMPMLSKIMEEGINFVLEPEPVAHRYEKVENGSLDFAVSRILKENNSKVDSQLLYKEKLVLVGSLKWAHSMDLQALRAGDYQVLRAAKWITRQDHEHYVKDYFQHAFKTNCPFPTSLYVNDFRAMLLACIKGIGISVLPYSLAKSALDAGMLIDLHQPIEYPVIPYYLICQEKRLSHSVYKNIHDLIISTFENEYESLEVSQEVVHEVTQEVA